MRRRRRGRALVAWYGVHAAFTDFFTPYTGFRVYRIVGYGEAEILEVDTELVGYMARYELWVVKEGGKAYIVPSEVRLDVELIHIF